MKPNLFDFRFFTGVVEDIDDPKMLGRVRVRIHGLHSNKTEIQPTKGEGLPFDYVPWAFVMMPCTGSAMTGFGESHGLLPGSWVVGMSRDGELYNDLVIIGSLLGQPTKANPNKSATDLKAFYGKDGLYPDQEFINEPDMNRLTRNELSFKDDQWKPVPIIKKEERIKNINKAFGGSWDEMKSSYGAKYPYNKVRSGPSGTVFEFDETPGAERISEFHGPSHTYREIHPDGSQQIKIVGDNYEITLKDKNLSVSGDLNIYCNGNTNILTNGDANIETKGDTKLKTTNLTADVDRDASIKAREASISVTKDLKITSFDGIQMNSGAGKCFIQGSAVIIRGQKTVKF